MEFKVSLTKHFKEKYIKLPARIREKFDRQFLQLSKTPRHPSLHIKRVKSAPGIWEGRVDRTYRFTFEIINGVYVFRNIDNHDDCLKHP